MATTLVTSDEINYLVYRYLQESGSSRVAPPPRRRARASDATARAAPLTASLAVSRCVRARFGRFPAHGVHVWDGGEYR
jgi:hypothetical protein